MIREAPSPSWSSGWAAAKDSARKCNLPPPWPRNWGGTLSLHAGDQPRILSLVSGKLIEAQSVAVVQNSEDALIPFCTQNKLIAEQASTVLITENFVS